MINKGFVDFIGSDAHDLMARNTDIEGCFDDYSDEINMTFLNKACCINPLKVINNEQIEAVRLSYFAKK